MEGLRSRPDLAKHINQMENVVIDSGLSSPATTK